MSGILGPTNSILTPGLPTQPDDDRREFGDSTRARSNIFNRVLQSAQNLKPITNTRHTLRLSGVDDADKDHFSLEEQKQAILAGKTLGRRLRGTWELVDNASGEVLDSRQQTIARVPYLTPRGTFINNGNEYTLINQARLRPGVFTRVKENGEIESHLNSKVGTGPSHRYFLDPEKGVFSMRLGQAKIPVMPLLKAMGATDRQLKEAWGNEIWEANAKQNNPAALNKLYQRLIRNRDESAPIENKQKAIAEAMAAMELDPQVTHKTLGKGYNRAELGALVDITKKLLGVSRGEQDVDDRDHLAFQTILGPEDLLSERLEKDYGGMQRELLRKASFRGNLGTLPNSALTKQIESVLISSGLGSNLEEINTAELLDKQSRITRMGEGGINSADSVPDEARSVQPSHMGYVDPTRTPESLNVGVDLYLSSVAQKGNDGKIYIPLKDLKTSQTVYKSPQDLVEESVAFPGELKKKSKRVGAMQGGALKFVHRDQIRYELPTFENAFSPLGNLIPMKSAMKAQRLAMGSRMSVAPETVVLIQRADGTSYYGPIADYEWRAGDKAHSFDKETGKLDLKPVRSKTSHICTLPMYRVTLKSGRSVEATADHSFVTLNEQYVLEKIHTQDLVPGAAIPILGALPLSATKYTWNVPAGAKHNAFPACEFELDFELGWVHGMYLSEGWSHQDKKKDVLRCVAFAALVPELQIRLVDFFDRHGIPATIRSGRPDGQTDRVIVNWKQLGNQLRDDFGLGSYNKRIPGWVFTAPAEYRQGIIAGYMAGDGCYTISRGTPRVWGGSRSRALRDGLSDVLRSLGIHTTVLERDVDTGPRGTTVTQYNFNVVVDNICKLPATGHPRKYAIQSIPWSGRKPSDWFPRREVLTRAMARMTSRQSNVRTAVYVDQMTRTTLEKYREGLPESVQNWLDSPVRWDKVVSVKEVAAPVYVYDLDMGDGVFVCNNGIIVHNTAQALPLEKPEAPLVQSGIPGSDDDSYENKYGKFMGAIHAERPGRVVSVAPGSIKVKYDDGKTEDVEMYNHFSFNRKTFAHNTPVLQPGDTFKAGQLLAKSNYTDDQGVTALGKNLLVGYVPYKGFAFEDATVISESAAKRLTSEHMYQHAVDLSDTMKTGKRNFISLFPSKYDKKTLSSLDDDGVIKPGTVVNYGDPLILAARQRDDARNKIHKKKAAAYSDITDTWEHHTPGVVTDVYKGPKGITAFVKSMVPTQVGDKLSNRFGGKGVISGIVPDDEMPRTADGRPLEIALNPLGVISRVNPAQIVETALGKIAAKTGKPYRIQDFESIEDLVDFAEKELQKHGMQDLEDVIDPETDTKIPQVLVGNQFFMKLHHTSASKTQGRSTGGYSADDTPAKGGDGDASKRMALLDLNALLSHGSTAVIRDSAAVRGQKNEDYWLAFMRGVTPPQPKVPRVYEKFVNYLKGSGINVVREGTQLHIMALTNKDVEQLAGTREIQNGETVKFDKDLEPVKGGLFDPTLTGSHEGNRWSKIRLAQPLPNPVMEEPIRKILGLTQDKFDDIIAGKERTQWGTGPQAISKALEMINLDKELEVARAQIASGKRTWRDDAIKKMGYLKSAKELGIHPKDWVLSAVPVLPPRFRPVSTMTDKKLPLVSDPNYLYKEMIEANDNWKQMSELTDDAGDEQLAAYKAFKAVTGLGDPVHPKLVEKGVQGLLRTVFGSSPKFSQLQRRLLSTPVDVVGRAVIAPNPELDMDQVSLPEDKAWNLYKPFVVRRLKRRGLPIVEAMKAVENRTPLAKNEMLTEMQHRPVIINRAPVLHKYGIMAFWPQLTKHNTMEISPLVVKGFNADFDGDQMNFHVPVEDDARKEAIERLMPSANLLSAGDFKSPVHAPSQEYVGGLYAATAFKANKKPRTFRNSRDLRAAVMRGEVGFNDPVELLE